MPAGNGTGPQGLGPRTGRGAGYCAGYSVPGYVNPRGRGRGRGGGFGWGWRAGAYPYVNDVPHHGSGYPYSPEPTAKEEMSILKEQSELLKQQLEDVQDRINTLESAGKQE